MPILINFYQIVHGFTNFLFIDNYQNFINQYFFSLNKILVKLKQRLVKLRKKIILKIMIFYINWGKFGIVKFDIKNQISKKYWKLKMIFVIIKSSLNFERGREI